LGVGAGKGATERAGTGACTGIVTVAVAGDVIGVDVGVGVGGVTGVVSTSIFSWFSCRALGSYEIMKYNVLTGQLHGSYYNPERSIFWEVSLYVPMAS
jgi:hypothetical protein